MSTPVGISLRVTLSINPKRLPRRFNPIEPIITCLKLVVYRSIIPCGIVSKDISSIIPTKRILSTIEMDATISIAKFQDRALSPLERAKSLSNTLYSIGR